MEISRRTEKLLCLISVSVLVGLCITQVCYVQTFIKLLVNAKPKLPQEGADEKTVGDGDLNVPNAPQGA